MEYTNRELEIIKSDKDVEDICTLVKYGLQLGYSCNLNLTQQQKQELTVRAKQVCDFAEWVAKLANRL